ncbi:Zinc finger BED domain-containing protein 4 [Frankliniella fusca]|uniref:Zinc finger BED domain-containing protein 4 n=1 Tax=Frankliniella fusca TaxID=407009 RepID=A0AAE1I1U4_9NEOP|nr:Zinc finger BED domain-containing protein 4 [Frankliniella fusca]
MWTHLQNKHGITNPNSKSKTATGGRGAARAGESNNSEDEDDPQGNAGDDAAVQRSVSSVSDTATAPPATASEPQLATLLRKRRSTDNAAVAGASPPKQMTIPGSIGRASSFQEGGERDATQRDALLFMMMKENLPLSLPQSEGFLYYNSKTTPLWKPPSRQTMTRLMERKYQSAAQLVKSALAELPAVCLTADSWTDSHTTKSYLGTTVHFVIDACMEAACIGVTQLEERHTGLYLAEKLTETCEEWGILKERVNMVIFDNAENIKLAVKTAFGENKMLNCFDHTLNLIPKYALGNKSDNTPHVPVAGIPQLIRKMKDIVTFSHTSCNFANELSRIQVEQFHRTEGTVLRLIQDVRTRWGSTFKMIERFRALSDVIYQAAAKFPEVTMLTAAELATLRTVMDVLRPFHEATTEMGAEHHTTSSKVIPTVHLVTKAVQNIQCSEQDTIGRAFRDFCLSELRRRFGNIETNRTLALATMLDPRFIKAYFQVCAIKMWEPLTTANTMTLLEMEVRQIMRAEAAASAEAVRTTDELTEARARVPDPDPRKPQRLSAALFYQFLAA